MIDTDFCNLASASRRLDASTHWDIAD